MDAYGNLTEINEFTQFRSFRLISYLDEDCALGFSPGPNGGGDVIVSRLSIDPPERSIFIGGGADIYFTLQCSANRYDYVCGIEHEQPLFLSAYATVSDQPYPPNPFTLTFIDGCWFNLYIGPEAVVDIGGSDTSQGNRILSWELNGGDNQKWRATTVGPGLK